MSHFWAEAIADRSASGRGQTLPLLLTRLTSNAAIHVQLDNSSPTGLNSADLVVPKTAQLFEMRWSATAIAASRSIGIRAIPYKGDKAIGVFERLAVHLR